MNPYLKKNISLLLMSNPTLDIRIRIQTLTQSLSIIVSIFTIVLIMILLCTTQMQTYMTPGTTVVGLSFKYYPVPYTLTYCPTIECVITNNISLTSSVYQVAYSPGTVSPVNIMLMHDSSIILFKLCVAGVWISGILQILNMVLWIIYDKTRIITS
jgi:hypothetical protein